MLEKYCLLWICQLTHSSWHHRITEWSGLEGAFKGHLVQAFCIEQGCLQLDQVVQNSIQPGFEYLLSGLQPSSSVLQICCHQHQSLPQLPVGDFRSSRGTEISSCTDYQHSVESVNYYSTQIPYQGFKRQLNKHGVTKCLQLQLHTNHN